MSIRAKFRTQFRSLMLAAAIVTPTFFLPASQAHAGVFISVNFGPPVLPVYVQPPLPAPGYIWTPGYWAYGDAGYYWVPGVWVQPPSVGLLWTPGYWGFVGGAYRWNAGYWGPHVGFYGGVNYGFGYGGVGFFGGEWRGGVFAYNSAVANFGSVHVTNVYVDRTVIERNTIVNANHVSYNGGSGGITARATPAEMQAANEHHVEPTANQTQHENFASHDRGQLASVNGGHPATMAAANVNSYHQVAQQHAQSQPISQADRNAGSRPAGAANQQRPAQMSQAPRVNSAPASQPARPNQNEAGPAQQRGAQATQQRPQASQPAERNNRPPANNEKRGNSKPEKER